MTWLYYEIMTRLVSREEIFRKSSVADHFNSECQIEWFDRFGFKLSSYFDDRSLHPEELYDHLEPFHNEKIELDDFAVISCCSRHESIFYKRQLAGFASFFKLIGIERLYLLDELKCDWTCFPFDNREKREALQRLLNEPSYFEAFEFHSEDFPDFFNLFHKSGRFNTPIVRVFSASDERPIAMFLCDDGNLHTSFESEDRERFIAAAEAANIVMGGLEVCER